VDAELDRLSRQHDHGECQVTPPLAGGSWCDERGGASLAMGGIRHVILRSLAAADHTMACRSLPAPARCIEGVQWPCLDRRKRRTIEARGRAI